MGPAFWTNTIWYILLGVAMVLQLVNALARAKNPKPAAALFLTVSGMAFTFEAAVCFFLKAYSYYPMIFPMSPMDDTIAGNLFSQYSITASALLIAVLNLRYYWSVVFALGYSVIEKVFLHYGLFEHNWYRTWITFVGLVILFWIVKRIYRDLPRYTESRWRYVFIFLGLFAVHTPTAVWSLRLLGLQTFSTFILKDSVSSYSLIVMVHLYLLSIVIIIIYFFIPRWWKAAALLALYIPYYIAYRLDLFWIKDGWFLVCTTINVIGMYLAVLILDRLYGGRSPAPI